MKSEERHELQQNDLASWVYTLPILLKQYGSYILLTIACAVLAFQLYSLYERKQQEGVQKAWNELLATDGEVDNPPAKLRSIISTYEIRPVQAEAYLRLGRFYLQSVLAGNPADGFRGVKVDKENALGQAESAFKKAIAEFPDFTNTVAAATLELGAVEESRRNWDGADKYYATLMDKKGPFAGTPFADEAEHRHGNLEKYKTPIVFGPATPKPVPTSSPYLQSTTLPSVLDDLLHPKKN